MTSASGGRVGAGAWDTGFGQGSATAAVMIWLALLAIRPLGVALTVQTHT